MYPKYSIHSTLILNFQPLVFANTYYMSTHSPSSISNMHSIITLITLISCVAIVDGFAPASHHRTLPFSSKSKILCDSMFFFVTTTYLSK